MQLVWSPVNAESSPRDGAASSGRTSWPLVLVGGAAVGVVWGVVARLWMRFISDDPEFSWGGTGFILGAFGIAGLSQSAAYLGRRARLTRGRMTALRAFTTLGLLPLGLGAGMLMLPTVLLAPFALTRIAWPRAARCAVGLLATLPFVVVVVGLFADLPVWRAALGSVWCAVVYAGLIWAAQWSLAPVHDGWRVPAVVRIASGLALAVGVLAAGTAIIGAGA